MTQMACPLEQQVAQGHSNESCWQGLGIELRTAGGSRCTYQRAFESTIRQPKCATRNQSCTPRTRLLPTPWPNCAGHAGSVQKYVCAEESKAGGRQFDRPTDWPTGKLIDNQADRQADRDRQTDTCQEGRKATESMAWP